MPSTTFLSVRKIRGATNSRSAAAKGQTSTLQRISSSAPSAFSRSVLEALRSILVLYQSHFPADAFPVSVAFSSYRVCSSTMCRDCFRDLCHELFHWGSRLVSCHVYIRTGRPLVSSVSKAFLPIGSCFPLVLLTKCITSQDYPQH